MHVSIVFWYWLDFNFLLSLFGVTAKEDLLVSCYCMSIFLRIDPLDNARENIFQWDTTLEDS